MSRDLWPWALEVYGQPGTAEACLDLQDSHHQSVPLLLWAAWAAQEGRPLGFGDLMDGSSLAARWDEAAVAPLRAARRALKPPVPGVPDPIREGLRGEVKALELKAEQILMAQLEAMTPAAAGGPLDVEAALNEAAQAWAFIAPRAALAGLAQTLS
jgi:uncharacterized protein (TIGR02444 family)